jgi:hypothetical protein
VAGRWRDSFPGGHEQAVTQPMTCGRRGRRTMDTGQASTIVTDGQLGRERPSRQRPGAKSTGENPGSLTPQFSAATFRRCNCGPQRTPPARCRPSPQRCASPAVRLRSATARIATRDGSPIRSRRGRRGNAHPESFIPLGLPSPPGHPTAKGKEMLVVVGRLDALDTRSPTLQCVASHR